jgi:hypothetical protein
MVTLNCELLFSSILITLYNLCPNAKGIAIQVAYASAETAGAATNTTFTPEMVEIVV